MSRTTRSVKLAERILLAAREFHNAIMDLWDKEDHKAIALVHAALKDHERITEKDGNEIEGWEGNCIQQADSVLAVLDRFELLFGDFIKGE